MTTEKPDYIRAALQVLEDLRTSAPEQEAEFRQILPTFAAKAAQSGENVTENFLKEHLAQGKDHLQVFVKTLQQKPRPEKTALSQYKKIKTALRSETKTINERLIDAAENGDLDLLKRCVEQGGNIRAEKDRALCFAAENGDLDMVKYCFKQSRCNSYTQKGRALANAAVKGHLNIIKYCVEQAGCNSQLQKDRTLCSAAWNGHLDIVKYCVERGADLGFMDKGVLRGALIRGHLDMIKYCVKKGYDLRAMKGFLHDAAGNGHLGVVKYCIQRGCDLRAGGSLVEQDLVLYLAAKNNEFEVVKYCLEQGCDLNNTPNPEETSDRLQRFDDWVQKHGTCPKGLANFSPHYFKAAVFADILPIISAEGYKNSVAHRYAYHAAGLFGSTKRVLTYFEKWAEDGDQPFHNVIQNIKLPQQGRFNKTAWADAILKHGPKMARLIKFANRFPEPLKNADGSWSYLKTREKVSTITYPNGHLNPALAALCFQYNWDEANFNDALDHIEKYQQKYAANDNQKPMAHIPDIEIDGGAFDKDGYRFYKLPDGDLRGLFLGEMTNCCQHLAGLGADCASHGFLNRHSGFYAIESKETGQIIGQSWAWRGKDKALVLDSLESLSGHFNARQWQKLTEKLAAEIAENTADITALHIGTGGATPRLGYKKAAVPSKPKEYNEYRDSKQQYQVWKRLR